MRQAKSKQESVANVKKLRYPSLSPANIQTLKIRETDPDLYSLDDKVKYISLDKLIETGVLTA